MKYIDIQNIILNSNRTDWLSEETLGIYTYRCDLNIRFHKQDYMAQDLEHRARFEEEWAENHPDKEAYRFYVDLYYAASWVERFIFVAVDGGRADIPLPDNSAGLSISKYQYAVGAVINVSDRFDEYLARSGISVK